MGSFLRPPMLGPGSFSSPVLIGLSLRELSFSNLMGILSIKKFLIDFFVSSSIFPK